MVLFSGKSGLSVTRPSIVGRSGEWNGQGQGRTATRRSLARTAKPRCLAAPPAPSQKAKGGDGVGSGGVCVGGG